MPLPLEGLRVVDLSHVIAGPLASFYLAQLGAEVIKVEPLSGDVMRHASRGAAGAAAASDAPPAFTALNAGKQSFAVDLRDPRGATLVRDLAMTADVFIENLRPGKVARYGLDHATLMASRPELVYCSISGFGQQGAWAARGAYDHVVQAVTGMMRINGEASDTRLTKVGFPVIDVAAGMSAALAVVSALLARLRHGGGQVIDASMAQASLMLMYPLASAWFATGFEPERVGNRGFTGSPSADTYRCADGWLAAAANTPAQFRKLTAALGIESLCSDAAALDLDAFNAASAGFVVARDLARVRARIAEAFAGQSAADMEERLNALGVPAGRVRSLGEFLAEVTAQPLVTLPLRTFAAAGGPPVRTGGLGFATGDESTRIRPRAPALGEHTATLLAQLGVRGDEIDSLERAGVVFARTRQPA